MRLTTVVQTRPRFGTFLVPSVGARKGGTLAVVQPSHSEIQMGSDGVLGVVKLPRSYNFVLVVVT